MYPFLIDQSKFVNFDFVLRPVVNNSEASHQFRRIIYPQAALSSNRKTTLLRPETDITVIRGTHRPIKKLTKINNVHHRRSDATGVTWFLRTRHLSEFVAQIPQVFRPWARPEPSARALRQR